MTEDKEAVRREIYSENYKLRMEEMTKFEMMMNSNEPLEDMYIPRKDSYVEPPTSPIIQTPAWIMQRCSFTPVSMPLNEPLRHVKSLQTNTVAKSSKVTPSASKQSSSRFGAV